MAWGPDTDRRARLLIYLAVDGHFWTLVHIQGEDPGHMAPNETEEPDVGLFAVVRSLLGHPRQSPRASLGFKVIKSLLSQINGRIQLDVPLDLPS